MTVKHTPPREICQAVRRLATVAAYAAGLNERQTVMVAIEFQKQVDLGFVEGRVAMPQGFDEDGRSIHDWEELR